MDPEVRLFHALCAVAHGDPSGENVVSLDDLARFLGIPIGDIERMLAELKRVEVSQLFEANGVPFIIYRILDGREGNGAE